MKNIVYINVESSLASSDFFSVCLIFPPAWLSAFCIFLLVIVYSVVLNFCYEFHYHHHQHHHHRRRRHHHHHQRPSKPSYFTSLPDAASSAAAPASRAAAEMCESANGQMTVTSQQSALPFCQGTRESPSGRFLTERDKPVGSLTTGMPAAEKLRAIELFREWCLIGCLLAKIALEASSINHWTTTAFLWRAQFQPEPQTDRHSHCLII